MIEIEVTGNSIREDLLPESCAWLDKVDGEA